MTASSPPPVLDGRRFGTIALEVSGITAGYDTRSTVLADVSMSVPKGGAVALLGANGAGKTTLLRVISGLLSPRTGTVRLGSEDITKASPNARSRKGICLIPEGRGIFRSLTVRENLDLLIPPWADNRDPGAALEAFPVLGKRLGQTAGSMSGGEQQMLALSRAFLAKPDVVLVDEVSMGLSPMLVDQIFESLTSLVATTCSLVIVEQYVSRALELADYAYVLRRGSVAYEGLSADLDDDTMAQVYLG
jgi:branched-chain amino acid transport system ATP-binding protein